MSRFLMRFVCRVLVVAVPVAGLAVVGAVPVAADEPKGVVESFERPDAGSAMQSAVALDRRVEDVSQRSVYGSVFANPDGTWTSESAPEPVQAQSAATGDWADIDPTLVEVGDEIRPVATDSDLVLSSGGDKVFARMTVDGQLLEWRWPTKLPAPTLDGATATYADVRPSQDLVVEATSSGFAHFVVLREAPGQDASVVLPIATHGAVVRETGQGGLQIKEDGQVLADAPAPVMWDSSADEGGNPAVEPVGVEVDKLASGRTGLTLIPSEEFLADPDTVYPVSSYDHDGRCCGSFRDGLEKGCKNAHSSPVGDRHQMVLWHTLLSTLYARIPFTVCFHVLGECGCD